MWTLRVSILTLFIRVLCYNFELPVFRHCGILTTYKILTIKKKKKNPFISYRLIFWSNHLEVFIIQNFNTGHGTAPQTVHGFFLIASSVTFVNGLSTIWVSMCQYRAGKLIFLLFSQILNHYNNLVPPHLLSLTIFIIPWYKKMSEIPEI